MRRALVHDQTAPSFSITSPGRVQKAVHEFAKLRRIVRTQRAAPRGRALEVVHATKGRPENRNADEGLPRRALHEVANQRHVKHRHAVVDPERTVPQRMERVRYANVPKVVRNWRTDGIWKQLTRRRLRLQFRCHNAGLSRGCGTGSSSRWRN